MAASNQHKTKRPTARGFESERRWMLLGLLLILAGNVALRWRLADTPLERDEGEYAYAGQLLRQGIPPYQLAYNMKFPGTYFAYAALMTVCGETARGIHLGLALVTSLTAVLVFLIGNKLFHRAGGLLAAASYVLLAAAPAAFGLAGHATHFVALFATAGALALLWADEKPRAWKWWGAGLMFGAAMLMKQHAVIIAGLGLMWIGARNWRRKVAATVEATRCNPPEERNRPEHKDNVRASSRRRLPVKEVGAYVAGGATALLMVGIGLACAGVWKQFYFWTIQYATQYASAVSIQAAWPSFVNGFGPVLNSSWALWLLGGAGLVVGLLPRQAERNSKTLPLTPALSPAEGARGTDTAASAPLRRRVILILFLGGMLAACPGYHFRGHYFLAALPGLALLIAAAFAAALARSQTMPMRCGVVGLFGAALALMIWSNREIWFTATPDQVARQIYSLNPFLEAPKVADYLREHTAPEERIAVVGSEPEIYFHAHRKSASGYIYMYALTEPLPLAQKMRDEFAREIETAQPRYIVFVDIITSWVSLSAADTSILTWWNQFSKNYEAVGAVTLTAGQPTTYCWEEAVVRTLNLADCHLVVYRRKNL